MFSHIMIGSNDTDRSKKFYVPCLVQWASNPPPQTHGAGWLVHTMAVGS